MHQHIGTELSIEPRAAAAHIDDSDDHEAMAVRRDSAAVSFKLISAEETSRLRRYSPEAVLRTNLESVYSDTIQTESMRELLGPDVDNRKSFVAALMTKYKIKYPEVALEPDTDKLFFSVIISAVQNSLDEISVHFLNETEKSVRHKVLQHVRTSETYVDNSEEVQMVFGYLPRDFLDVCIIACSFYTKIDSYDEQLFVLDCCANLVMHDNKEYLETLNLLDALQKLERVFFTSFVELYFNSNGSINC